MPIIHVQVPPTREADFDYIDYVDTFRAVGRRILTQEHIIYDVGLASGHPTGTSVGTMRPQIPSSIEERIDRIYRQEGFDSPGELVRHATLRYLNEVEADHHVEERLVRDTFEHTVRGSGVGPTRIRFVPKAESPVRFQYFAKGNPPHVTILDTGRSFVGQDEVEDAIADVAGVASATVLTRGELKIAVSEDNPTPLTGAGRTLVDDVYEALGELIERANRRVLEGEETRSEARERAIEDYWPYATS